RVAREPVSVGVAREQRGLENTIATDHTDGAPPKRGSTILVNIGCTMNTSAALRVMAAVNVASTKARPDVAPCVDSLAGRSAVPMSPTSPPATDSAQAPPPAHNPC